MVSKSSKAKAEAFISVPVRLVDSDKYNSLSPYSQRILLIFMKYLRKKQPYRRVVMSYSEIQSITGYCRERISKSLSELQVVGYIQLKHKGSYRNDASEYILGKELFVGVIDDD